MATLTLIIGSIVLFAGTLATWYALWHRRMASRLQRIPVSDDARSAHARRKGVSLGDDAG